MIVLIKCKKMKKIIFGILFFIPLSLLLNCKKLVDVDGPKTSLSSKDIYNTDATAIGTLTSLYSSMSSGFLIEASELPSLSYISGLSSDELTLYIRANNSMLNAFYQNDLNNITSINYWSSIYKKLYIINSALEGLNVSQGLSPSIRQQLLGEAKFMRGFYYFYLANLYGDVPLVLSTDYSVNSLLSRSPKALIYTQIIADLNDAEQLLSNQYLKGDLMSAYPSGAEERVRPIKSAANGLLARTYLYQKEWAKAEIQATTVIQNTALYKLETLDRAFLKNNKEAIWQLQPTQIGWNAQEANYFVLPPLGPSSLNPFYCSQNLIGKFELGDQRKTSWLGSVTVNGFTYYFPYKYKIKPSSIAGAPILEYTTVFRLAEQFLIRAEARTELNNFSGAIADVNEIRKRAGLSGVNKTSLEITKDELLEIIMKERQIEFFAEWGHRWLDLKRTEKIDQVMTSITPQKGNNWKNYQQYYPIPLRELEVNPNLTPSQGY